MTVSQAGAVLLHGVNVSAYQGTIDWSQVASGGIIFAYMRALNGVASDSGFAANWASADSAGIVRGAYQYIDLSLDAKVEAQAFATALAGNFLSGDLPPLADLEDTGASMTVDRRIAWLTAWCAEIEKATGVKPAIYASSLYWTTYFDNSMAFTAYPLFIASWSSSYPSFPSAWTHWDLWAYSGSGMVPGISGASTELTCFSGTSASLAAFEKP